MPVLRILCFFILLISLAGVSQYYLQYRERYNDNSSFQVIDFYKEKKNTADAVFIGSSCCFSFYSPLFAYENYGIRTMNYSSSGMGMMAYRYAIEEVRKTQEDALIVLSVSPNYQMEYLAVHFMSDYMPLSMNKVRFLTKYFTQPGESILNSIGFFFPIMEYHDRWAEIDREDLIIDEGIKGATRHRFYLSTVNSITDEISEYEEKEEMPENMELYMMDLLDYCDDKKENIIFVFPPKTYKEEDYRQMNSLAELIRNRGYELLDLRNGFDEIGLLTEQDFYDIGHTNIHGSIKYTDYLARFVMNRRSCTQVKDPEWDRAIDKYSKIIDSHVLDIETDMKKRDYWLAPPKLISVEQDADKVLLSWQEVDGADHYYVYRKDTDGFFRISDAITETYFSDGQVEKGKTYVYTVLSGKDDLYGNYDYKGLKIEVK